MCGLRTLGQASVRRPHSKGTTWHHRRANICSVTSQGHPHARFRRALSTGNPRLAEAAARDLHHVSLADALELCLLYRGDPERYERAAARWIARLIAERPKIHLSEIELAAAGFREAVHSDRGVVVLRECLAASTRATAGRAVTGAVGKANYTGTG